MTFPSYDGELPYLSTAEMIEVDRLMIEVYHITLMQMMENAGRNLANLARARFLAGNPQGKGVVILAGTGGNGGGALVCARRLHNYGAQVMVFLTRPAAHFKSIPAHQLDILKQMNIPTHQANRISDIQQADLIVDGLIGYSLSGAPRASAATLIDWANSQTAPILALDVPSGIDSTSGTVYNPAIRASATMTLALPKQGLRMPAVAAQVGELYLADISVPAELYAQPSLGLRVGNLFAESDIIRLSH